MVTPQSLAKPTQCETRKIRLTSRLLHVGGAVSRLNPFEYVQTDRFVYLSRPDALAKVLKSRGFLNDYIQKIETRSPITRLLEDAIGQQWWEAEDAVGEPLFPAHLRSLKWADNVTDLRPMIRNGFGVPYIPGSSLKGAVRTAIAYHLLKHSTKYSVPKEQYPSAIEKRLQKSMGELKRKARFADDPMFMNALFSEYDLVYQGRKVEARCGPNTDFMRAVQVSDTEPLIEERIQPENKRPFFRNLPIVPEVVVSSRFADYRAKHRAAVYAEMMLNVRSHFTISVDTEMLGWFRHQKGMQLPFQSVGDILRICREFAQDQWDLEHDYWASVKNNPRANGYQLDFSDIREMYEPERCPYSLRVGWASGFMGTTVNLLLPDETTADIRDRCGIPAPGFEAPKSRRTVMNPRGEIKFVPSWVRFEEV